MSLVKAAVYLPFLQAAARQGIPSTASLRQASHRTHYLRQALFSSIRHRRHFLDRPLLRASSLLATAPPFRLKTEMSIDQMVLHDHHVRFQFVSIGVSFLFVMRHLFFLFFELVSQKYSVGTGDVFCTCYYIYS